MHIRDVYTILFLLWAVHVGRALVIQAPATLIQCSVFSIGWDQGKDDGTRPEFNLTVLPFDSVPYNITIPSSAYTSNTAGTFSTTVPISVGSSFVLSTGSGSSGATSNIITVTDGTNDSCLTGVEATKFTFGTNPTNCNPSLLNVTYFSSNLSDVPIIQGYVPSGGGPFEITVVQSTDRPMWFVSVQEETQMVIQFMSSEGDFGTSRLLTVGGNLATNQCFGGLFFTTNTTKTASNTTPLADDGNLRNKSAKLLGIIIGSVLGVAAIVWAVYAWKERKRRLAETTEDRGIRGGKGYEDKYNYQVEQSGQLGGGFPPIRSRDRASQRMPDRLAPGSRSFPYNKSSLSSGSQRPPMRTMSLSASGREVSQSLPKVRTPGREKSFDAASYDASLLPVIGETKDSSQSIPRPQTRESGRVV